MKNLDLSFLAAVALALLPACSGAVETQSITGSTGSSSAASSGGPAVAPASVRFANFSVWLEPFDVCAGAEGGGLLAASGLGGGLAFGQVSRYLPAPPGAAWTLVRAGTACSDPAGIALAIPRPVGAETARVTVVPWERPSFVPQVTAFAYLDEPYNDQYGINLRVLDFLLYNTQDSAAPLISVYIYQQQDPVQLFSSLQFAAVPSASTMGPVTAAGFVHTPDVEVGRLEVDTSADVHSPLVQTTAPVPVPPSAQGTGYGVVSIFVAGGLQDKTARVIVCADDSPAEEALSSCTTPP
jgi:hypothetical protein